VTTLSFIPSGRFVIEYAGELMTADDGHRIEEEYEDGVGCYIFYFKFRRSKLCIDSTRPAPNRPPGERLPEHMTPDTATMFEAYTKPWNKIGNHTEARAEGAMALSSPPVSQSSTTSNHSTASSVSTPSFSNPSTRSSSSSSPTSSNPSGRPPRMETLGYGIARYINHRRNPNLSPILVDCPSQAIRTSDYDASASQDDGNVGNTEKSESSLPSQCHSAAAGSCVRDGQLVLDRSAHYPRLCFYALRNISAGEELTIDYGDRDKGSLEAFPWLSQQ